MFRIEDEFSFDHQYAKRAKAAQRRVSDRLTNGQFTSHQSRAHEPRQNAESRIVRLVCSPKYIRPQSNFLYIHGNE